MRTSLLTVATVAAIGFSLPAFAEEAKTPTGPAVMSDSEMDAVTAGTPIPGAGLVTADSAIKSNPSDVILPVPDQTPSGIVPGVGRGTAPGQE
jgi:hypothetical protein